VVERHAAALEVDDVRREALVDQVPGQVVREDEDDVRPGVLVAALLGPGVRGRGPEGEQCDEQEGEERTLHPPVSTRGSAERLAT
jgi:hypothetical protein